MSDKIEPLLTTGCPGPRLPPSHAVEGAPVPYLIEIERAFTRRAGPAVTGYVELQNRTNGGSTRYVGLPPRAECGQA
jgi:hypothetical protein